MFDQFRVFRRFKSIKGEIKMRKGQVHTEETKEKIAAAKLGKTFTPEHSLAISQALKGQKKTAMHKAAIAKGIKLAKAKKMASFFTGVDSTLPNTENQTPTVA